MQMSFYDHSPYCCCDVVHAGVAFTTEEEQRMEVCFCVLLIACKRDILRSPVSEGQRVFSNAAHWRRDPYLESVS